MNQTLNPFQVFALIVLAYGKARNFLTFRHCESEDSGLWFLIHFFGVTFIIVGVFLGLVHLSALSFGNWSSADHLASAITTSSTLLLGAVIVFVVKHILMNRSRR